MENLISNHWCSYGTMFDAFSIDQQSTAWRTTRPSKQIGSAVAWVNSHFCDEVVEGTTPNRQYWIRTSDDDIYSDPNNTNKGLSRTVTSPWAETDAFEPSNVWDDIKTTTDIPRDRNT
jgi:hypothetical protein